jgi:hypothetical protein
MHSYVERHTYSIKSYSARDRQVIASRGWPSKRNWSIRLAFHYKLNDGRQMRLWDAEAITVAEYAIRLINLSSRMSLHARTRPGV